MGLDATSVTLRTEVTDTAATRFTRPTIWTDTRPGMFGALLAREQLCMQLTASTYPLK